MLIPDGWQLVPKEPTLEQLDAMPSLPAIKLPVPEGLKHLRPHQYQNRERYLAALASAPTPASATQSFQDRVKPWMLACFNEEIAADRLERADRFIEEALELVQSGGYDKERAHALVEYVYGRPQGDVNQEVGGVMVTLAAYCLAFGVDMHVEAERELARINQPEIIEKIRAKQAAKPKGSALPIATPASAQDELVKALKQIAYVEGETDPAILWPWAQEIALSALSGGAK